MLKVAVIGVGSMGQNHARVYFHSDQAQLVAISDAQKMTAETVAKKYNTKAYSDYRQMLDDEEIDAVSIAVPTSLHHEVALEALKRKKHVLLEKPIAATQQEAQELIACAQENNVQLMIGHIERFNTAIQVLKERLTSNELGEIYKIDVQRIGPFPSRITDVGVIIDLSVHDLDIISYLLSDEPERMYAETQHKLHPHHEDSVTALVKYKKGVLAVLNINYLSPTKTRQLKIFGKKGMFEVNYLDQELYFYENKSFASDDWQSVTEGDMKRIFIPKKEPLQVEIEAFLRSIAQGTTVPVSGAEGLQILLQAQKLLLASTERRIIEFP